MKLPPKSDVGQLRLESPTSDIEANDDMKKVVRTVPLRDLARYAGRLVRATAAEGSELVVTDRGRPLVVIAPVRAGARPPRYVWRRDSLVVADDDGSPEAGAEVAGPQTVELPDDLPSDLRAVADLLLRQPMSIDDAAGALSWTRGRTCVSLARLEMRGLAHKVGTRWCLRERD